MLSTGTPSTTYKGSLLPLNEVVPRTRTTNSPPGVPLGRYTFTPAALPCIACAAEAMGRSFKSSNETEDTAVVTSPLLTVP